MTDDGQKFDQRYECVNTWKAHGGRILASVTTTIGEQVVYVTGGNDGSVALWNGGDASHRNSYTKSTHGMAFIMITS